MVSRGSLVLVLTLVMGLLALGQSQLVEAQDATPEADVLVVSGVTDVRYVLPFTPDGLNSSYAVSDTVEGVCGEPSLVAHDRPDAWDCITTDHDILDPCFEDPYGLPDEPGQLACLSAPFDREVVLLTLTEPLVRQQDVAPAVGDSPAGMVPDLSAEAAISAADLPWGLELANGDRCALLRGTLTVMAGQVVHYGCANGGLVFGETHRDHPLWSVDYLAEGDAVSTRVGVIAAWN
ncbi:MAG TPA: hypothetical protein VHG52_14920 [Thermomicrobiales bacterium]|nr:hypothetical protein [Thermomicrobiales bacterium]